MKSRLFFMALAGVALASCVNDELADVSMKEQSKALVRFDAPVTYANASSRADGDGASTSTTSTGTTVFGEIGSHTYVDTPEAKNYSPFPGTYTYPQEQNFMVGARVYTGDGFNWDTADKFWTTSANGTTTPVDFLEVSWQGKAEIPVNGWKTTNDFYWPASGQLAFVAYSPAKLSTSGKTTMNYGNAGWTINNFAVNNDYEKQIDVLYSEMVTASGNTVSGDGKYHGVQIQFRHALSAVHFVVIKPAAVTADVELKKIVIKNVFPQGSAAMNSSGVLEWTPTTGVPADDYAPFDKTNPSEYLQFTPGGSHIGNNGGYPLLLMPQSLANVKLDVYYTVDGKDKEATNLTLSGLDGYDDGNVMNKVTAWEPGKKYIYVLKYAGSARDVIYFGPSTINWVDIDVEIPLS